MEGPREGEFRGLQSFIVLASSYVRSRQSLNDISYSLLLEITIHFEVLWLRERERKVRPESGETCICNFFCDQKCVPRTS